VDGNGGPRWGPGVVVPAETGRRGRAGAADYLVKANLPVHALGPRVFAALRGIGAGLAR